MAQRRALTVGELVGLVGSLVTVASMIPLILAQPSDRWTWLAVYVASLLALGAGLILIRYRGATFRLIRYCFPGRGQYTVEVKESVYEFESRTRMRHKKTFTIRSRITGLHEMSTRFGWSGPGELQPRPIRNGDQIAKKWEIDKMTHFTIVLDRHYKKGEYLTTGFEIDEIRDPSEASLLYLSTGVFERTRLVRLVLKCAPGIAPHSISVKRYKGYFDQAPEWIGPISFSTDTREAVYECLFPLINSKHIMEWEF